MKFNQKKTHQQLCIHNIYKKYICKVIHYTYNIQEVLLYKFLSFIRCNHTMKWQFNVKYFIQLVDVFRNTSTLQTLMHFIPQHVDVFLDYTINPICNSFCSSLKFMIIIDMYCSLCFSTLTCLIQNPKDIRQV